GARHRGHLQRGEDAHPSRRALGAAADPDRRDPRRGPAGARPLVRPHDEHLRAAGLGEESRLPDVSPQGAGQRRGAPRVRHRGDGPGGRRRPARAGVEAGVGSAAGRGADPGLEARVGARLLRVGLLILLGLSAPAWGQVPGGSWQELPGTSFRALVPTGPAGSAVTAAWSGAAYDSRRQRLLVIGGGPPPRAWDT